MVIVLAGVALRLIYLHQFGKSPLFDNPIGPDVKEYDNWAREILAWGMNSGRLHIHAPLYPLCLAAMYVIFVFKLYWVRLAQTLIVFAAFALVAWLVRKYLAPEKKLVYYVFIILAALYPPLIFYSSELLSEVLLLPLICIFMSLLYLAELALSAKDFRKGCILIAGAGIISGLMAITHPVSLMFVFAEIVFLFFSAWKGFYKFKKTRCYVMPVLFAVMAMLIIVPVCVNNSLIAKRFVLIQRNSGFNFYLGNNPEATGTCYVRPGNEWTSLHQRGEKLAEQTGVHKDSYFRNEALKFIVKNPFKELQLLFKKALYVWNYRELIAGADAENLKYYTPVMLYSKNLFVLLGIFCITGLIMVFRQRDSIYKYRHFIILLAAFWGAQIITLTSGRYRLAMYPAFFLFAGYGVDFLFTKRNSRKELAIFFAAALFASLLVILPKPYVNFEKEQAEADSLLGEAYFKQGKIVLAMKHFEACLKYDSKNARAYNFLGIIYEKKSPVKAVEYYQAAIKNCPDEPEAYMNLAINYSAQGNFKKADEFFKKALLFGSGKPDVLYNFACFLQRTKRIILAEKYLLECLRIAPWYEKALNTLGVIYIQTGKKALALEYLEKAHSISPSKTGIMLNLAVAYYINGNRNEALKTLDKVLENDPESVAAKSLKKRWQ